MNKIVSLLSIFLIVALSMNAQTSVGGKVVLCDSYDDYGTPTGIHSDWSIAPEGGYVYILYTQDRYIGQELSLYIDKKNKSGNYVAFDTRYFKYDADNKKRFAVYDYEFKEEGDYKISVVINGTNTLATTYSNVAFTVPKENIENKKKAGNVVDTYYFEDSKITFGTAIDDKAVVSGEAGSFSLMNGKRDIVAKLQQDKDLNVTQVVVEVYGGVDYKEKVYTQTYNIPSKTWNWIKVPLSFTKPGKYVVDMYNEDDVFINSGYVEITRY
jgi:hypothetical protein